MSNTSDQPPAVREAAEPLTKQDLPAMAKQAERALLLNGDPFSGDDWAAMQVVRDYTRLSAEVARLTDYIKSLETTTAQWLNTNQKEIARLRGLNAELLTAGEHLAGYLDSFFASHMRECGRFECLKRWDAVAGRAAAGLPPLNTERGE